MRRLSPETYRRVIDLLAQGRSVSQASKEAPCRYSTVQRIAAGTSTRGNPEGQARLLAERCPGCGRQIYVWPCLGCMMTGRRVSRRY